MKHICLTQEEAKAAAEGTLTVIVRAIPDQPSHKESAGNFEEWTPFMSVDASDTPEASERRASGEGTPKLFFGRRYQYLSCCEPGNPSAEVDAEVIGPCPYQPGDVVEGRELLQTYWCRLYLRIVSVDVKEIEGKWHWVYRVERTEVEE